MAKKPKQRQNAGAIHSKIAARQKAVRKWVERTSHPEIVALAKETFTALGVAAELLLELDNLYASVVSFDTKDNSAVVRGSTYLQLLEAAQAIAEGRDDEAWKDLKKRAASLGWSVGTMGLSGWFETAADGVDVAQSLWDAARASDLQRFRIAQAKVASSFLGWNRGNQALVTLWCKGVLYFLRGIKGAGTSEAIINRDFSKRALAASQTW
jgi:hypothetical protein